MHALSQEKEGAGEKRKVGKSWPHRQEIIQKVGPTFQRRQVQTIRRTIEDIHKSTFFFDRGVGGSDGVVHGTISLAANRVRAIAKKRR